MILQATVVHVCACDTESTSTYDCNIVLISIGSCTNGNKMLDGFTKLCSNYKNGVLLASQKAFRWTAFVTNNVKVVNLRAMQTVV